MSDSVVARLIAGVFVVPGLIGLGFSMTHESYGLLGLFGALFLLASLPFSYLGWQAAREPRTQK